jgi:hypothetical protein
VRLRVPPLPIRIHAIECSRADPANRVAVTATMPE